MNIKNPKNSLRRLLCYLLFSTFIVLTSSCNETVSAQDKNGNFSLSFEEYQLDNGLKVILHQDKSDPIVAVNMVFNVGSNREEISKTGFAHLFEHLLFKGSENVPKGEFNNIIADAGGWSNGGTGRNGVYGNISEFFDGVLFMKDVTPIKYID